MARILAIDWGTKRTGIAVSDPLRIIGAPLETVPTHLLTAWLADYFAREEVDTVVIGLPRQMDGSPSETARHIEPFARRLAEAYPEKLVAMHDERFTSVMAHRAMIDGGVKRMARRDRAMVDRVSAAIILQSYMTTII